MIRKVLIALRLIRLIAVIVIISMVVIGMLTDYPNREIFWLAAWTFVAALLLALPLHLAEYLARKSRP